MIPLNQFVNSFGKYIYKQFDKSYRFKIHSGNMCEVQFTILYSDISDGTTIYEMPIAINITTYADKVRIYIIELDENQRTLGFITVKPNEVDTSKFPMIYSRLKDYIIKRLNKFYDKYNFIY